MTAASATWTSARSWNILIGAIALECLVIFGVGPKALAFACFGAAVVVLGREEPLHHGERAIVGVWLAVLAAGMFVIGIATDEVAYSLRPLAAAVAVGGAALATHALYPHGFGRREVAHSALVAVGLGFAGWTALIATFVGASILAGIVAAKRILDGRDSIVSPVSFSATLALVTAVAIPFA